MPTTTILSEDTATIVGDDPAPRFNWGATFAGAAVATAVTFFLMTLGSGIGLAVVSVPDAGARGLTAFLTLGAVYFFASQAFGFAAGGHLVGRLIGPMAENSKEEEFRAGAHGLVVWASTVVASLAIVAFVLLIGGSAVIGGAAAHRPTATPADYWADMLLRRAAPTPDLANDKAEASRILTVDLTRSGDPGGTDHAELARLVAQNTGLSGAAATDRVDAVETGMRDAAARAAETVRKAVSFMSLWTAFALLFGAIVAVAAAISARWEDDRIIFSWAPRR